MSLGTLYFFFNFGQVGVTPPPPPPVVSPVIPPAPQPVGLPPWPVEDEDTLEGVVSSWESFPQLMLLVPGGIHAGRIAPGTGPGQTPQGTIATPYAELRVEQGPSANQFLTPITLAGGGVYFDYRHVTLALLGKKKDVLATAPVLHSVFDWQPKGAVPLAIPNGALKRFLPLPGSPRLEQDPKRKAGEDIWRFTWEWECWTVRTLPARAARPVPGGLSAVGSGSEDEDTLETVRAYWAADTAMQLLLPGGPQLGRIVPPAGPLRPYAAVRVQQGPTPNAYQAPATSGAGYHDYRHVTVQVLGRKADVVAGLGHVRRLYEWAPDLAVPGGRLLRCMPLAGAPHLLQDGRRKDGEDVWRGLHELEIWTVRTIP